MCLCLYILFESQRQTDKNFPSQFHFQMPTRAKVCPGGSEDGGNEADAPTGAAKILEPGSSTAISHGVLSLEAGI